ncbi:MAG TPA: hypothetical protein VFM76_03530 [Methylophaga sp.]|nr:hypothetical protein [Methylophaga sp.]
MKLLIVLLLFVSPVEAQESIFWKRMLFTGGNHIIMGFASPTLNIFIEDAGYRALSWNDFYANQAVI